MDFYLNKNHKFSIDTKAINITAPIIRFLGLINLDLNCVTPSVKINTTSTSIISNTYEILSKWSINRNIPVNGNINAKRTRENTKCLSLFSGTITCK